MRVIFLLLLLTWLVESAPLDSECKYEIFKAKMCFQLMPPRKWNLVPKEEFAVKKSKFEHVLTCLGEPKCELTQNWLKFKKAKVDRTEAMCQMHGCLGNGTFKMIEYKCYTNQNYTNCLVENIRTEAKCDSSDLKTFEKVVKFNEEVFQVQAVYIENLKKLRTENHACRLDIAVERHEFKCQFEEKNMERSEPEFSQCLIRRIEENEKCNSADLNKLKEVLEMVKSFKKQIGHKEQFSGKDDDYLVDF